MTADEYRRWWAEQEQDDPYFAELNRHYHVIESRDEGFDHVGSFAFGSVLALEAFPEKGFSTLLTKGLSGFRLLTHADDRSMIRIELAWTVRAECAQDGVVSLLSRVADMLLERRYGFFQNEVFPFDFSSLPLSNRLTSFLASNGYWLADGFERLDSNIPMYVFELFALTADEADIATHDLDAFAAYVEDRGIDLEDLRR